MKGKAIARVTLIGLLCSVLVFMACSPQQAAAPTVTAPTAGPVGAKPQGWEADWQATLAAAKKENNLSIYTAAGSEVRTQIGKWYKEKFGLEIDWTPIPAAQTSPKVFRERQSGLYLVDIQMGALSRQLGEMKPAGILAPIKPLLILPEVLDKNAWFGGDIPWVDNDKAYTLNNLLSPEHRIAINTNLVKPGEITSYNDLLDPKWKGKIALIHPILNGRVPAILHTIMGPDYLRKLAAQQPVITENQRLGFEWVAQGKYPIMIFSRTDEFMEFERAGAPIAKAIAKEGTTLAGGAITFSMLDRSPHPNTTKIFVNWWMGKELGIQLSKFLALQAARLDVPTDHLPPDIMRDPKVKYVNAETEDFQEKQAKLRDLVQEIFGSMLK
ncbi:MAG: ABC transporter substrate-binding protein [Chloroflexi bacterium]|nr:ABC transporter substrate-binding protein [Chloroflexota bacterium]